MTQVETMAVHWWFLITGNFGWSPLVRGAGNGRPRRARSRKVFCDCDASPMSSVVGRRCALRDLTKNEQNVKEPSAARKRGPQRIKAEGGCSIPAAWHQSRLRDAEPL